jgi:thioesterase domain-containing protein/acyl carrier protein
LQDLLAFYDANCSGENAPGLPAVPSYKFYLNWIKRQDPTKAATFWKEVLKDFEKPTLVGSRKPSQKTSGNNFQTKFLELSLEQSQKLREFALKNQITLNTLVQGMWAILLSRYVDHDDVAFGITVSGRTIDLPNAERMAGMYMNVLPFRIRLDENGHLADWLRSIQIQQAKIRAFEYCNMDEILSSESSVRGNLLFNSVVVFQNIPFKNNRGGGVSIESFESGLTSNYALTLSVSPLKELNFSIKYDSSVVSEQQIGWFFRNLDDLIKLIIENRPDSLSQIKTSIPPLEIEIIPEPIQDSDNTAARIYIAPRNEAELKLVGIWENLLNVHPIGVNEDFFDLGGTSIIAIRLFTEIEKQFQKKLQASSLLNHRNVKALAKFIAEQNGPVKFSSLVPLRATGSKPPIFCLHAGGGHVFFYKDLAKHLGTEQPVYALQRIGVDDVTEAAQDIESTASLYLKEIRKVQPNGPFSLLAYCFSITVCWEMVRQLKEAGDSVLLIAIIDSQPPIKVDKPRRTDRINRILNKARRFDFSFVKGFLHGRIVRPLKAKLNSYVSDQETLRLQKKMRYFNLMYDAYNWQPLPVKITLIRSAEYSFNDRKNQRASQWNNLALNGVNTYVVDGNHKDLFNEPEVKQLADQLSQCLNQAYNDVAKSTR